MDYRYLKQRLMRTFQQLVIFDLREVKAVEVCAVRDNAIIYDLTTASSSLQKVYYMGSHNYKPLIVILEKNDLSDPYQSYLSTVYNLYGAIVKHQTQMVSFQEMEDQAENLSDSDRTLHWIWFRDKDTYLPDKIMSRAKSWIELNPDFTFYLWTNLIDPIELDDFLSTLHESNRDYFTSGRITVKYHDEMLSCLDDFCQKYRFQLDSDAETILHHLFDFRKPVTEATTNTTTTSTHTTVTTTIQTVNQNNYKINRIFRVDLWRVIVINLFGGIYCDFNDTICFYPMKYLLTMYPNTYFVGTDYDIEHPVFRNNYFIYSSLENPEFTELSLRCINKGIKEYIRLTEPSYINIYYDLCIDFIQALNQQMPPIRDDISLVPIFLELERLKLILEQDKLKDIPRIIMIAADILGYFERQYAPLKSLSQKILSELEQLDINCLKISRIKRKNHRRYRYVNTELVLPINYDQVVLNRMITGFEFHDYFLMKYAIHMTIGDLILSTNISYIDEIKNLIPYSRSNRLSTISMLTHVYDGTSYGLTKNYETFDQFANDLRREFL